MPGFSSLSALRIGLMPWLAVAAFPPAGDFFRQGRQHSDIYASLPKAHPFDESQPLETRARAYLDAHCSACHRPEGVLRGSLDLRFATPLAQTGLFASSGRRGPEGYLPRLRPGIPRESDLYRRLGSTGSDAMPPLGRTSIDERGLALVRAWIEGMSAAPPSPPSSPSPPPSGPTTAKVCDSDGHCRPYAPDSARGYPPGRHWIVEASGLLPRGRYWLVFSGQGRAGHRILLAL